MSNILGNIEVRVTANTSTFASELDKAAAKARSASNQIKNELRAQAQEAKHTEALFGEAFGVKIPRHIRGFVAELPGVGKALSAAFSGVVVLVLIQTLVEAGKKVYELVEAFKAAGEAGKKISEGFKTINEPLERSNHQIELSIIKTENAIAKLEHKPQNVLAQALAEAGVKADELSEKLGKAFEQSRKLLMEQTQGKFMQLATGSKGTGQAQDIYGYVSDMLGKAPKDATHDAYVQSVMKEAWRRAQYEINKNNADDKSYLTLTGVRPKDHTAANTALQELQNQLSITSQGIALQEEANKKSAELQTKQSSKELSSDANRSRMQKFENELAELKQNHALTVGEEIAFWQSRINAFATGSAQYLALQNRLGALMQAQFKEQKAFQDSVASAFAFKMPQRDALSGMADYIKNANARDVAVKQGEEVQQKNTNALAAANIQYKLQAGYITELQAAQQMANLHTTEYNQELKRLEDQLADINRLEGLSAEEKAAEAQKKQNEIDALKGQRSVQEVGDRIATSLKTAGDGARVFWRDFIQEAQNTGQQVYSILSNAFNSLNDNLAKLMTGQSANWKQMFQSLGEQSAKSVLMQIEAPFLKALGLGGAPTGKAGDPIHTVNDGIAGTGDKTGGLIGWLGGLFGKKSSGDGNSGGGVWQELGGLFGISGKGGTSAPNGTQANPFYVINAGGGTGALGGGSLMSMFSGSGDSSDDSGDGSGGFLGFIGTLFGGGKASGGDVDPYHTYMVGENGPELFNPGVRGSITPNHKLNTNNATYNIDARGTNAADVDMRVKRGMQQTHAASVQQSMAMSQDYNLRRPQSRGGAGRF